MTVNWQTLDLLLDQSQLHQLLLLEVLLDVHLDVEVPGDAVLHNDSLAAFKQFGYNVQQRKTSELRPNTDTLFSQVTRFKGTLQIHLAGD